MSRMFPDEVEPLPSGASWRTLAERLFDRYGPPAVLIGAGLRILRVNESGRVSFGWSKGAAVGRPLTELAELVRARGGEPLWPSDLPTADGEVVRCWARVTTSTGHAVERSAEVRIADPAAPTFLVEIGPPGLHSALPPPTSWSAHPAPIWPEVVRFDIDTRDACFGTIHEADPSMKTREGWVGKKCYQNVFDLPRACSFCPLRTLEPDEGAATEVIYHEGAYHVVRCKPLGPAVARVTHRHLDVDMVRGLVGARLEALADEAGLSERERSVFELLVLGRSLEEVAHVLEIRYRTVRFHQTNLLEKLGADSRLDLIRLLL